MLILEQEMIDQVLEGLMNKFENFFKFSQNHPNEEVTITVVENNVVLKTQTGVEYKAAKLNLSNEEWDLLNEKTNWCENEGKKLIMPKFISQQEEDELLNDMDDMIKSATRKRPNENEANEKEITNAVSSGSKFVTSAQIVEPQGGSDAISNDALTTVTNYCFTTNKLMTQQSQMLTGVVNTVKSLEVMQQKLLNELKRQQENIETQAKRLKEISSKSALIGNDESNDREKNNELTNDWTNKISELIRQELNSQRSAAFVTKRNPQDRCFECDDYGHHSCDCPYKGTGLKKCYECGKFTTHKAKDCPDRRARLNRERERGRGSAKGRLQNFRRDNRQFQKRRNNDYPKEHGSKRARFNNRRGRSNYKNVAKNSNQPKQQQATNTKSGDSKMNKGNTYTVGILTI
ncbi:Protein of unknown function [Cotesia congregata]|uniref:CCHC-type domain-containing protein n=1 Tax=Cotesia congregata TaxID=51543 RepID=A0A8J2HES0_COTCN|nr:Protein of unknown function [Cotesia congregata]